MAWPRTIDTFMLAPEVPAGEAAIPAVPLIPEPGRLSSAVPLAWEKRVEPPRCCLSLSFFWFVLFGGRMLTPFA